MSKVFARAMAACEPYHSGEALIGRMLAATRPVAAADAVEPWPRPDGFWAVVDGGEPQDAIRARVGRRRGGAAMGGARAQNQTGGQ